MPIKRSITAEHIVCLEDGKKFKSLKRHLRTQYNMTPDQYRAKWSLPPDYSDGRAKLRGGPSRSSPSRWASVSSGVVAGTAAEVSSVHRWRTPITRFAKLSRSAITGNITQQRLAQRRFVALDAFESSAPSS